MCGIVGYTGSGEAVPILLSGLQKLEYRGYDSAGVAISAGGNIRTVKAKGRLDILRGLLEESPLSGNIGIGHTRWATHGAPSDVNSHPQMSYGGKFAVVHNGIIENYLSLKNFLTGKGVSFVSETDTEVVVQLLEYYYKGDVLESVYKVLSRIEGSYALGIVCSDHPEKIFAVRKDSPLIIGTGESGNFLASDIPAVLEYTRDIYRLQDGETAVLEKDSISFYNRDLEPINKDTEHIPWDISSAEKGGYEHFMMKEIHEQPKAIHETVSSCIKDGRISLENIGIGNELFEGINKIFIVACGTAYHVGVAAKYIFEDMLRISTEVDVASEFRYRSPVLDKDTLVIIISQSGETADTLAALRQAKKMGARTLSVVNVVGSTIANESDNVIYTRAGPEIAVASTKAYSTQLAVIYMISLYLADKLGTLPEETLDRYTAGLIKLPELVEQLLSRKERIQQFASERYNSEDVYFIGRNVDYAVSLEASLKLKEISYIHSEAYTAGELKHGPISLLEDGSLVIAINTYQKLSDKMLSNMKEVKARGAVILEITTETAAEKTKEVADWQFCVPDTEDFMLPSMSVVPLQLFAYYMASMRGCDIDKPRNLAKSVTVE